MRRDRRDRRPICEPGNTRSCDCPGGLKGIQTCDSAGAAWGSCSSCAGTGADAGTTDSGVADLGGGADSSPCGAHNTLCDSECVNLQKDSSHCGKCGAACKAGEVCSKGSCALSCPPGQQKCGGGDGGAPSCADLQLNPKNCGACGSACKAGEVCTGGKCTLSCPGALTDCNGSCVNLQSDTLHCGTCSAT